MYGYETERERERENWTPKAQNRSYAIMLTLLPNRQALATPQAQQSVPLSSCHLLRPPSGWVKCNASRNRSQIRYVRRAAYRSTFRGEEESSEEDPLLMFEEAVKLFNKREYYACHDLLESLWFQSFDPLRTLFHALLQCAVAFYHLFNQNHKGAMMEMGEGLCKLQKLNIKEGPFYQFEQDISVVLNFIYQTQLELAACNEDFCITMGQTEKSYQLLEGFAAGQHLYILEKNVDSHKNETTYIVFDPHTSYGATNIPCTRVKLPSLEATRKHLKTCEQS